MIVRHVEGERDGLPRLLMDLLTQAFDGFYNSAFVNRVYNAFFDKVIDKVIDRFFDRVFDGFLDMMTQLLDYVGAAAPVDTMLALAE